MTAPAPEQSGLAIDEAAFTDLIARFQTLDASFDAAAGEEAIAGLVGIDPAELQKFLEEKSGISPDEEAQGSLLSAIASIAFHC